MRYVRNIGFSSTLTLCDRSGSGPLHSVRRKYEPVQHGHLPPEQSVGRAQQGFQTLIYNRHHPVNHPPSPYQGDDNYLLGPYKTDGLTTAHPHPTTSYPSVFYEQVNQNQRIPITAEVSAIQSLTSPQALGPPSSGVLPMD